MAADYRCSEPAFLVLISLADGPKHGYAMTLDIAEISGHRPGPGTLYGAIAWLEERGWIEPVESDDRRQPYQLTRDGRTALHARTEKLRTLARIGHTRLVEN